MVWFENNWPLTLLQKNGISALRKHLKFKMSYPLLLFNTLLNNSIHIFKNVSNTFCLKKLFVGKGHVSNF